MTRRMADPQYRRLAESRLDELQILPINDLATRLQRGRPADEWPPYVSAEHDLEKARSVVLSVASTGWKSGSSSTMNPPGRTAAPRRATTSTRSGRWCSSARATTRSYPAPRSSVVTSSRRTVMFGS